jgi:hypothetical protein
MFLILGSNTYKRWKYEEISVASLQRFMVLVTNAYVFVAIIPSNATYSNAY